MIKRQFININKIHIWLIFTILICFGFFGSLSHLFSFCLISLVVTDHFTRNKKNKIKFNSKLLFFAISGIFLLFVSNGILHQNLNSSLIALSPLFPLPLIAIIILFSTNNDLEFTSNQLSVFAQISIIFAFLLYIFLSIFFDKESVFYQYHAGRLTLFSGNPIPFSFVTLGLSIFV